VFAAICFARASNAFSIPALTRCVTTIFSMCPSGASVSQRVGLQFPPTAFLARICLFWQD
jgi:hypothetical protein